MSVSNTKRLSCWFCAVSLIFFCALSSVCAQPFSTILNIPPDPDIGDSQSIASDTQLNLSAGGSIGAQFDAGASNGTSSNIEVNITGGTVGDDFGARSSSTVNITGGTVGTSFRAFSGSVVNISGGAVGDRFEAYSGGLLRISGNEFRLDGTIIDGLETVGNTISFDLPSFGTVLSGTLEDGTPFAFSKRDADEIANGALTLQAAALPAIGPTTIRVPSDPAPMGVRTGQTLIVDNGGMVDDYFRAGHGSAVKILGGTVGNNFEAVGAQVDISGATVGRGFRAFRSTVNISEGAAVTSIVAFSGSTVNISGGTIGGSLGASGSTVNIFGGSVGARSTAASGSSVNIFDGDVGRRFVAKSGGTVNISGGRIGDLFEAKNGGIVNITGGEFGDFFKALSGSEINLFGTEFLLDGIDITSSLTMNVPLMINDRNVTLSGVLHDGSPFSFDLNSRSLRRGGFFDVRATLTVTLVPEPTSEVLVIVCGLVLTYVARAVSSYSSTPLKYAAA